ncbi:MAG: hypothetical protein AAFO99_14180 [Bacteroidota bacterium]
MQKLQEQNESKKKNLPRISIEEYPIGFVDIFSLKPLLYRTTQREKNTLYKNNYFYLFTNSSFHPPTHMS